MKVIYFRKEIIDDPFILSSINRTLLVVNWTYHSINYWSLECTTITGIYYESSQKCSLWKTMPGCVKQVPQDSTESDRTDTGHSTDGQSNTCEIDISLF